MQNGFANVGIGVGERSWEFPQHIAWCCIDQFARAFGQRQFRSVSKMQSLTNRRQGSQPKCWLFTPSRATNFESILACFLHSFVHVRFVIQRLQNAYAAVRSGWSVAACNKYNRFYLSTWNVHSVFIRYFCAKKCRFCHIWQTLRPFAALFLVCTLTVTSKHFRKTVNDSSRG